LSRVFARKKRQTRRDHLVDVDAYNSQVADTIVLRAQIIMYAMHEVSAEKKGRARRVVAGVDEARRLLGIAMIRKGTELMR
jgi:hypothetical protein